MVELPTISPTLAAIDAHYAQSETRDHYPFIRGSQIGKCERHQWYLFRFAHLPEQFEGRMLRLFQTGHREEERMIGDLRAIGVMVLDRDDATGAQWAVEAVDGHFRGHADGKLYGLPEAPKTDHLLECKTHNSKSFAQLQRHGVVVAKPEHVDQMQIYMHLLGLTRAVYLAKNKDNDEYYLERVHYDAAHAMALIAKAERIKAADSAPPRIHDDPNWFACRFCASHGLCHGGEWALRTCRTCLYATPVSGGKWACDKFERDLSLETQKAGCPSHLYLPSLVPGEQVDVTEEARVVYQMPSGETWVDGGAA